MQFNKTVLPNGLRVITIPMADNPSVTMLVMVETGSKYETKDKNGISHFLEHMMFKGTPRRPKATDISRELDEIGAQYNAFTSQEYTGYYAKAASRHIDTVIDIVSDMYLNPLLEQKEIDKEKGVIIEEMRMYQDMPQRHVHDVLLEVLHGDQPVGWNVIGTEDVVKSLSSDDFKKYLADHYVSGATIVIVAGSFDEKGVVEKVISIFGGLPKNSTATKLKVKEFQEIPAIRAVFKETDQTHLAIALRTFSVTDPRIPVMQVMSTILNGGSSSRLWSRMREDLGICYYIRTSHNPFTDNGDLTISAGVDNSRVEEAVKEILAQCKKLTTELVPDKELKKAKDYIAGMTMLELETSDARAEFAGYQEVLKYSIESPADIIAKTQKVTAAEIQKLAREVFVDKGLNMAIIGKFKDADTFKPYFKF